MGPEISVQLRVEKGLIMSHPQADVSEEQQQQGDLTTRIPDPEVLPKAARRRFTARYKLSILREADRCTQRGETGALLRREGLYSSHLGEWRRQRALGQLRALSPRKRGRKPRDPSVEELAQLERENEHLRAQLEQAEIIIDVQKNSQNYLGWPRERPRVPRTNHENTPANRRLCGHFHCL